jgi:hypothetical protein
MNRKIKKIVDECIKLSRKTYGTTYFKVLIYGNTGVYYASPIYLHQDYNKTRLFDINEDSENAIKYFNSKFNL